MVAFYTDGLVERRNESLSVGLERLCAAVVPGPAETVARDIMHALVADTVPEDDIALVVIRRTVACDNTRTPSSSPPLSSIWQNRR